MKRYGWLTIIVLLGLLSSQATFAQFEERDLPFAYVPHGGRYAETRHVKRGADVAPNVSLGILDTAEFSQLDGFLDALPYFGDPDAPLIIGEFFDFSCPPCVAYHEIMLRLYEDFARTGQAFFVSIPVPLQMHGIGAEYAANAALCAGEQGSFWEMQHAIYGLHNAESPEAFTPDRLEALAEEIDLDGAALRACMESQNTVPAMTNSVRLQNVVSLQGVPMIIYSTDGGANWETIEQNGRTSGGRPYELLARLIRTHNP